MPNLKMPGRYKATVMECSIGTAQTGTPYVFLLLRTDEREMTDAYLYLSEKAFERTLKTLSEAFGFDGDFDTISRQLVGKRCSIVAEEEDDGFGLKVRVRWINPEQAKTADKAFLAMLTGRARSLLQGQPKAAPPAAPSVAPAADDDDDIPF